MTIQKKFSTILASTALVVTGFTPAMAAPINTGAAPATPIEMSQYVWNTDNATAEGRRGYRGYRGYRGNRGRRGHRRHRGRVSGGDVVAGILILGGIAAIASAASSNKRERRSEDRDYRDRDYRSDRRNNERQSQVGTTAMQRAISVCTNAAEQQAGRDARISEITAVARDGNGWRVEGEMTGATQSNFLCGATNDRVDFVQLGDGNLAFAN